MLTYKQKELINEITQTAVFRLQNSLAADYDKTDLEFELIDEVDTEEFWIELNNEFKKNQMLFRADEIEDFDGFTYYYGILSKYLYESSSKPELSEKELIKVFEQYDYISVDNYPGEGCAMITTDGRFVNAGYNTIHREIGHIARDNFHIEIPEEEQDDDPGAYALGILEVDLGWIRCNTGSEYEPECYINLENKKVTSAQWEAIQSWLEYIYEDLGLEDVQILGNYPNYKIYKFAELLPEDIVKRCKRFVASGTLYEARKRKKKKRKNNKRFYGFGWFGYLNPNCGNCELNNDRFNHSVDIPDGAAIGAEGGISNGGLSIGGDAVSGDAGGAAGGAGE